MHKTHVSTHVFSILKHHAAVLVPWYPIFELRAPLWGHFASFWRLLAHFCPLRSHFWCLLGSFCSPALLFLSPGLPFCHPNIHFGALGILSGALFLERQAASVRSTAVFNNNPIEPLLRFNVFTTVDLFVGLSVSYAGSDSQDLVSRIW